MSGLKRVCENYSLQMSPVGTAECSPGRESWVRFEKRPSPAGTAENAPGCNPGLPPTLKWTISDSGQPTPGEIGLAWDDCYSVHVWSSSPRTDVLGHSQPSLRDSIWRRQFSHTLFSPWGTLFHASTCNELIV